MNEWTGVPHPLPEGLVELIAQRFRVLGEPMRIRLLDHLRNGEASVGVLQEALGGSQQNISKHLGMLHQAGLVSRERRGTSVVYAVGDEIAFDLYELACGALWRQHSELAAVLRDVSIG